MAATSTMLPLGSTAPDFDLPDPDGKHHRLQEADGSPGVLVTFICNHCPYVKHVNERLSALTSEWMDRGLTVFGIASNDVEAYPEDAPPRMAAVAAEVGYRFPYLYDEDQSVARAYRAACTPDFFLFDADRKLVYRGQFDDSRPGGAEATGADLAAAVEAVLAGAPVPEAQRPSMGCSIKWKPGSEPDWS